MRISAWLRLLWQNQFRVHPTRLGLAFTVSGATCFNSTMRLLNEAFYRQRINNTPLVAPPVFIVGHWRSGTTYLHELMSCDERLTTPSSYQCFAANHFLFTQSWLPKLIWFLMPTRRPMDNVRTSWDSPQEDEFALCSLGAPSPYLRIAFPNNPRRYDEYLDLAGITDEARESWEQQLVSFLRALTVCSHKQLVLKSPTHTARVATLARLFPGSRFVHIVRDPRTLFPSTMKLWQVLDEAQALQRPDHRNLQDYVFETFERMYDAFESQRAELTPEQLVEVRYEDVVASPIDAMRSIYERLDLGDFEAMRPRLEAMTRAKRRYKTNRYELPADTEQLILSRWRNYATKYGYLEAANKHTNPKRSEA
jgi:omega-hydroxy-beta-dihydromenaquinone-9 sulfotransferase